METNIGMTIRAIIAKSVRYIIGFTSAIDGIDVISRGRAYNKLMITERMFFEHISC